MEKDLYSRVRLAIDWSLANWHIVPIAISDAIQVEEIAGNLYMVSFILSMGFTEHTTYCVDCLYYDQRGNLFFSSDTLSWIMEMRKGA